VSTHLPGFQGDSIRTRRQIDMERPSRPSNLLFGQYPEKSLPHNSANCDTYPNFRYPNGYRFELITHGHGKEPGGFLRGLQTVSARMDIPINFWQADGWDIISRRNKLRPEICNDNDASLRNCRP